MCEVEARGGGGALGGLVVVAVVVYVCVCVCVIIRIMHPEFHSDRT